MTLAAIVAVAWLVSIPARRYEKRTGKKMGRGAAGAGLNAVNEIFQPSAANASVTVEEQRESRVGIPAAEGDPLSSGQIVIDAPKRDESP